MATELQILANRANALKSTGPKTPEGKSISSRNAVLHDPDSRVVGLKGEPLRRYGWLVARYMLEFQPHGSAETSLVRAMILAEWRMLRLRGTQTTALRREMARARRDHPPAPPAPDAAFLSLAENSPSFLRHHRLEDGYARLYARALAALLKLRASPRKRIMTISNSNPILRPFRSTPQKESDP